MVRLATRKVFLEPRHAILLARMALWVVIVSFFARITSLPRTHRIVSACMRSPSRRISQTPEQLARTIDSLLRLDLFMFKPSCWKRALVLHRFLRLSGTESRINFGLQKSSDGTVRGHAWLDCGGRPFLENDTGRYVVTFSLPRQADPPVEGARP